MSSLDKAFSMLALFTRENPVWQPDEICDRLGFARTTGYRYVKELVDAGFLQRAAVGRYSLGPKIIELDYQVRQSDPVLLAAVPIMEATSAETGLSVALSVLFSNKQIIDTHRVNVLEPAQLSQSRGRPHRLFRSAATKILISYLSRLKQKKIYQDYAAEIAANDLGKDWETFRKKLAAIRKAAFAMSLGELEPHLGAIAVPVFNPEGEVVAALGIFGPIERIQAMDTITAKPMLERRAKQITEQLTKSPKAPLPSVSYQIR